MNNNVRMAFVLVSYPRGSRSYLSVVSHLSKFEELFIGSINIPIPESSDSAFGLLVRANTDQIGALTGALGQQSGVKVKTAFLPE